jgi:hypothetical protein
VRLRFVFAALAVAAPSAAAEARPSARLVYAGAEGCPEASELAATVAARLGYEPFGLAAPRVVDVRLQRKGGVFQGRLEMRDADGHPNGIRELASADCRELVSSLSVAIAIGIDPLSLTRQAPTPPAPTPEPPKQERPPPQPEPKPPSAEPILFRFAAGTLIAFGTEPATAFGLTAQAGIRRRALSAALEGRADFPASADAPAGGRVTASLVAGSVVPCAHVSVAFACGAFTLGALRGEGQGVSTPLRSTDGYAAAGARAGVELRIAGPIAARVHGDLAGTITRIALDLDGRTVWSTPTVSGALGADVVAVVDP